MKEITLKPCPFCGGKASFLPTLLGERWCVECANFECGVIPTTPDCKTKEEAAEVWNVRVGWHGPREKIGFAMTDTDLIKALRCCSDTANEEILDPCRKRNVTANIQIGVICKLWRLAADRLEELAGGRENDG